MKYILLFTLLVAVGAAAGLVVQHWTANGAELEPPVRVVQGDFAEYFEPDQTAVVVYSLSTCPNCAALFEVLDAHGIEYQERELTESGQALAEVRELGAVHVPVVLTRATLIEGYDPEKTLGLLNQGQ